MEDYILQKIKNKENIALIGETNSGKTWFIKNQLAPYLEKHGIKVAYFENCDKIDNNNQADCFIVDEVEVLTDWGYLKEKYGQDYYSNSYLEKVKNWYRKLLTIIKPTIFIITRNHGDAEYLVNNFKYLEWNQLPVNAVKFNKLINPNYGKNKIS